MVVIKRQKLAANNIVIFNAVFPKNLETIIDKLKLKINIIINLNLFKKLLFLIHFKFGAIDIKIKNGIKKGIINLLKNGGPTEIFSLDKTSKKIGYTVPIKITDKKYITNQLFRIIEVSLV